MIKNRFRNILKIILFMLVVTILGYFIFVFTRLEV